VDLLVADVDPEIVQADIHVGVTGEAHPHDVERRYQGLVGAARVDVLERDNVAHVFGGPLRADRCVLELCHAVPLLGRLGSKLEQPLRRYYQRDLAAT
jgi:hypothetical protein